MQRGSGYQTMLCRGSEKAEFKKGGTFYCLWQFHLTENLPRAMHCVQPLKKNAVFMRALLITFQKTTVSGGTLVHSGLSLRNKLTPLLVAVSGKNVL